MAKDLRIVAFISGRGSNLQSLIKNCPSAKFEAVVTDTPEAPGLAFARSHGIHCQEFDRKKYASLKDFRAAIREYAKGLTPDLIVLAGYMRILEPEFIHLFAGRVINIHPSLLPKYPGLETHARALAARETVHGCTVHVVDNGMDTGPIIAQASVPVGAEDTEASLSKKVLTQEHLLYPWVVNNIIDEHIRLFPHLEISEAAMKSAKDFGFVVAKEDC